ncbi:MAG: GumC family protein, partial [Beijerinckiaceae bacterium]
MNRPADIASLGPQDWFSGAAESHARPAAQPAPAPAPRIFEIADLFDLLYRGRKIIIGTVAATSLAALAFGITSPKRYTASAQMFIDVRGYRVLNTEVQPSGSLNSSPAADFETELQFLTSGAVLARVVEKERLTSNSEFAPQPGFIGTLVKSVLGSRGQPDDKAATALRILEKKVAVKKSDRSFVAELRVTTMEPRQSARLVTAVADAYLEFQAQNRQDFTRKMAGEIASRLQDLRERVQAAEKRLAAYKRENKLVSASGTLVSEQDLTELNKQLNDARTRTTRAKAQLDQIRRLPRDLGVSAQTQGILNSPTLVQLQVRLADAQRQLAEVRRNLGSRHPEVQAAQARVGEMRNTISAEVQRQRRAIEAEFTQSRRHERALAAQIADLKTKSSDVNETLIGARELERAVEANRKVYEEFLVRARELNEQQSIAPTTSRVISPALPPNRTSNIPLVLLLAGAILGGLPLGVGLAFLQDALRNRRRGGAAGTDRSETAGIRNVHAVAASGQVRPQRHNGADIRIEQDLLEDYLAATRLRRVAVPPDELLDAAMAIHGRLGSDGSNITLVCTYGDPAAAHHFSAGFAACLAWQGYDALLADGDALDAGLSRLLNLDAFPGLFDRFHQNIDKLVLWNKAGLPHILPAMPKRQPGMPQGARRQLAHRLEDLAESAEYVIVDAGDLAANPYAPVFMDAASQAILIGSCGGSPRSEELQQMLADRRVRLAAHIELSGSSRHPPQSSRSNVVDAAMVGADAD